MHADPTFIAAFLVGLFGSVHCVGMCSGIVGAFTMGIPEAVRNRWSGLFPYLISYNSGRIISYMVAGILAGLLGQQAGRFSWQPGYPLGAIIAGGFMIALGLYLAGWWRGLVFLEQWGGKIWRRIEPLGRHFIPVGSPWQALGLGLVWGWLPCGMVYAALAWSLTTAAPLRGGLLMLAFGLGTLPMLLTMGGAARSLTIVMQKPIARRLAGLVVILFGLYTVSAGFLPDGAAHHQQHAAVILTQ